MHFASVSYACYVTPSIIIQSYFVHKMQGNRSYACFYTTNIPIKTRGCINYSKCPSFACNNMDFSNTCK